MASCPHCGNYLLPGGRFCELCGAKTPAAETETQAVESTLAEIECFLSVFGKVTTTAPGASKDIEDISKDIGCFLRIFGR